MNRIKRLLSLSLGTSLVLLSAIAIKSQNFALEKVKRGNVTVASVGLDKQIWQNKGDRQLLIQAIDESLNYLKTSKAAQDYHKFPIPSITEERVRRSLLRFRTLLLNTKTPEELQAAVSREFVLYQAVGTDPQKTVIFTGYYEPIYEGSLEPTAEYRYPLYRKPQNFDSWSVPHPTRTELEGKDGLSGTYHHLAGQELVWLKSRLEAYLVQIQGSATIKLPDGKSITVGYDGGTDYPYVSIGKELINDGVFKPNELSLPVLKNYLDHNPTAQDEYIPRNNRFVFFRETHGAPPQGSIGVPITPERSIATDKSLMPPGALALIHTYIPQLEEGKMTIPQVSRYVLDQDTGSAIKGPGRVDIFMGVGKSAGDRAGLIKYPGQLYYLLLNP